MLRMRIPFFLFLVIAATSCYESCVAARLIRVEVSIDNVVILRGSTSDDGSPDADAVWNYLKEIKLKPTEDFHGLPKEVSPNGTNRYRIPAIGPDSATGELDIHFGGVLVFAEIDLIKVESDEGEERWMIDPKYVDHNFDGRMITRREASLLTNPRRRSGS